MPFIHCPVEHCSNLAGGVWRGEQGLAASPLGSFTDFFGVPGRHPQPWLVLIRPLGSCAFKDVFHFPCHLVIDGATGGIWVRQPGGAVGAQLASRAAGSPEHLRKSCLILFPRRIFVLLLQKRWIPRSALLGWKQELLDFLWLRNLKWNGLHQFLQTRLWSHFLCMETHSMGALW